MDITYSIIDINVPTRSALVLVTKDSLVSLRTYLNNKKQCLLAMMSRTEKKKLQFRENCIYILLISASLAGAWNYILIISFSSAFLYIPYKVSDVEIFS